MAIIKASNVKITYNGVTLESLEASLKAIDFTIPDNAEAEPIHIPKNLAWSIDVTFAPPRTIHEKIIYRDITQDNPPN